MFVLYTQYCYPVHPPGCCCGHGFLGCQPIQFEINFSIGNEFQRSREYSTLSATATRQPLPKQETEIGNARKTIENLIRNNNNQQSVSISKPSSTKPKPVPSEKRFVLLVGLTGSGKSSVGNLFSPLHDVNNTNLSNQVQFKSSGDVASCTKQHVTYYASHFNYMITDTMGLGDTQDPNRVTKLVHDAVMSCRDGVDVILFVQRIGRYTQWEHDAFLKMKEEMFGPQCVNNIIVVLTHSTDDQVFEMETQMQWLQAQLALTDKGAQDFKNLITQCGNRVVFTENKPSSRNKICEDSNRALRQQSVNNLVEAITRMKSPKFTPLMIVKAQQEYEARLKKIKREKLRELQLQEQAREREKQQLLAELEKERKNHQNQIAQLSDRFERLDAERQLENNMRKKHQEEMKEMQRRSEREFLAIAKEYEEKLENMRRNQQQFIDQRVAKEAAEKESSSCSLM